jgi:hypothetical protein
MPKSSGQTHKIITIRLARKAILFTTTGHSLRKMFVRRSCPLGRMGTAFIINMSAPDEGEVLHLRKIQYAGNSGILPKTGRATK